MPDGPSRTSRRAMQLARIAQAICLAGVASRAVFAIPLGFNRVAMGNYIRGLEPNLPVLISMDTWLGFAVVLAMDLFLTTWAFLAMFALSGALGRGETMSDGLEQRVIRLSLAAFFGTLFSIFARTLYSLVAFATDVPGPHRWGVDLSPTVLYKAVATIFLFLFVMIVRELRRVDAENKSFI